MLLLVNGTECDREQNNAPLFLSAVHGEPPLYARGGSKRMAAIILALSSRNPPPRWMHWVSRYINLTVGYGAFRALTYEHQGTKEYYNTKTRAHETKAMLWTDSIGRVFSASIHAITVWPVMLCADLKRLECFTRGLDHASYHQGRN